MSAKSRLAINALRPRGWRAPSRPADGGHAARSLRRRFSVGLATAGATIGLVALVGGIHAGAMTTLQVNSTVDADTATNSSTTCLVATPCTLREAIHVANNLGGQVLINVPAGTYTLGTLPPPALGGELQLGTYNAAQTSYAITIQGQGAGTTIIQQGDGSDRVFNLDPTLHGSVDVTIDGVTVSGGHDAHDNFGGAGIISGFQGTGGTNPDHTTLSNCVVTDNHVSSTTSTTRPGGGIQNIGGNLTITNCTISNNSSGSSEGGGVYYDSHSPSTGTLTVSGSTFSGNTLANTSGVFVGGAGLKVLGPPASQYLISNSVFTGNVATGSGIGPVGGGAISSNQGDLQVTRSTFTTNQANGPAAIHAGGGAINVSVGGDAAANLFVRLNRIVDNQATNGPSGAYAGAALDFANNWWGCNAGPGNSGCDGAAGATTNPRLTLTATASPPTILVNQTSTVTAALKINSAGTDTSVSLGATVQDGVAVGFANGSFGTVSPTGATLASATAATTYTAGSTGGADSVPVTIDHQTVGALITVQQPPHVTSANNTTFVAGTLGTFNVTAAGYPAPTFSETGSLPSGVTFTSSGLLSGTPTTGAGGTYAFTITATNGVPNDDTQSFTLTVNEAPFITSASATTFTVGSAGTFTVTSRGFPAPSITESGALPGGVSYNSSTHVLGGTPNAGTGGTYGITFTSHNGVGADSVQSFTLTVDEQASITSANNTTFTVGSPGTFSVTTGGFPHPSITGSGALPTGVTLTDNGDGTATLAGNPATGTGGVYPLTIRASNGVGSDATQPFTLTVNEVAAITSADRTTFTTGTSGTFSVTTSGAPKPSLGESGALPSGVTFTDNGNGTATLAGTPAPGTGGTYPITITAHNGISGDATQSFTLTVDQPPAITSANNATFTVGVPGSFTVTTSGFPRVTAVTETGALPTGVTFTDNGDGTATIAGTPGSTSGGVYPLTLGASNGVSPNASQGFTLNVGGAPQFTSADHATFVVGVAGSFSVTTTGSTPMTISETGAMPSGVSFTDNGNGTATLSGTPVATTGGAYHLTFTAHNGIGSDGTQSFTLTVNEAAAITSANHVTFQVGVSNTFSVATRGFPTPSLSESGALPSGVTFVDNHNGTATLSGTPAAGTSGTYNLILTAHNGVGSDGTQNFTLTVGAPPTTTTLTGTTATPNFGQSDTFTATVAPVPPATGTPAGTVTFSVDGTTTAVMTLVSGHASWTTSSLQQGPHTIGASYGGQANVYQPSSGTFAVTVGCGHTITGTRDAGVTINGGSWCISGATINKGVRISGGAAVSIVNSTVGGITSNNAEMISLCGDNINASGFLSISRTTGFVLIGSNRDDAPMPCAANSIARSIGLTNNTGGLELGANIIGGAVTITNNVMPRGVSVDAENTAPEIEANVIKGSLDCNGNSPAPTHDNAPNTVSGFRSGQCGAKGF